MDARGRVNLQPEDVPGAVLPHCSNFELRRWLECRGLKKLGTKPELVERVVNCINAGRENIIFAGVDGGKWYDAKRNIAANVGGSSNLSAAPVIPVTWGRFPSVNIPKYFNKGHIYTYFENEEHEVHDSEGGITEKPFRLGGQFVSSDHVHDLYDAKDAKCYHLKAKCFASFRINTAYNVKCTLNQMSGAVISGECECKQSALGKCSHVSAVLLFLAKFIDENGCDQLASTSKLREWGLGAKLKTPGAVAVKKYPTKRFNPLRRALYDPRPINYNRTVNVNNFICDLQNESLTMFETLLKLYYEDFHVDTIDAQVIKKQVELFKENMAEYMNQYETDIFPIDGAEVQGSVEWKKWRTYFITASNAKTASSLMTGSAKSNYLKKNLWQLTPSYALPAFYYGIENEPVARTQYILNYYDVNERLLEVGLYVNKSYPHLACSVDGLTVENNIVKRIIEIKCPKVLENADPCDFSSVLSDKQKGSFCLEQQNGVIKLKRNHPYMYQVVTSMLIFDVPECDFIVWSKINILVFKIQISDVDPDVIGNITVKLKKMYYSMYIPELFIMKIPRNLPLFELNE